MVLIDIALGEQSVTHRSAQSENEMTKMQEVAHVHFEPVRDGLAIGKLHVDVVASDKLRVGNRGQAGRHYSGMARWLDGTFRVRKQIRLYHL
jgi:hypothetical protein